MKYTLDRTVDNNDSRMVACNILVSYAHPNELVYEKRPNGWSKKSRSLSVSVDALSPSFRICLAT